MLQPCQFTSSIWWLLYVLYIHNDSPCTKLQKDFSSFGRVIWLLSRVLNCKVVFHLSSIMYAILPEVLELERFQTAKVTFIVTQGHWFHLVSWSLTSLFSTNIAISETTLVPFDRPHVCILYHFRDALCRGKGATVFSPLALGLLWHASLGHFPYMYTLCLQLLQ